MQTFTNASSLLPETRFLSASKTALQGPGPQLLPVLGRGSGGVVVLEVQGTPSQRGQDSGLNQHWAPGKAAWCGSGFPRGVDPWHGPRMCSLQGPQSYRQAHPPHDGPASVGLGAKPGPPSLWARASWTLRDGVPGGQHLCCSGTAPRGSVLWSRSPSISARGGPAGHWPGSGQACVLPHRVSR